MVLYDASFIHSFTFCSSFFSFRHQSAAVCDVLLRPSGLSKDEPICKFLYDLACFHQSAVMTYTTYMAQLTKVLQQQQKVMHTVSTVSTNSSSSSTSMSTIPESGRSNRSASASSMTNLAKTDSLSNLQTRNSSASVSRPSTTDQIVLPTPPPANNTLLLHRFVLQFFPALLWFVLLYFGGCFRILSFLFLSFSFSGPIFFAQSLARTMKAF
jgi:hypothetical protein